MQSPIHLSGHYWTRPLTPHDEQASNENKRGGVLRSHVPAWNPLQYRFLKLSTETDGVDDYGHALHSQRTSIAYIARGEDDTHIRSPCLAALLLCCFTACLFNAAYLSDAAFLSDDAPAPAPRPLIRGQAHQLLLVNAVQPTSHITRAASDVGLPGMAHKKEGRLVLSISLGARLVTTKLPFQRRAK